MFDSNGGGIHATAIIGHPPEARHWRREHGMYPPTLAEGVRIHAYVTVDSGVFRTTSIGRDSWLMKHVHVGHDVVIGADCELAPGVVVGGEAVIGNDVHIGINATIRPCVSIGSGARIGCGAVVTKDVPAGETWAGNPARKLTRREDELPKASQSWIDCRACSPRAACSIHKAEAEAYYAHA